MQTHFDPNGKEIGVGNRIKTESLKIILLKKNLEFKGVLIQEIVAITPLIIPSLGLTITPSIIPSLGLK